MKATTPKKSLPAADRQALLELLSARFDQNPDRHPALAWATVKTKLEANAAKLWSLQEMERTGGEPDVIVRPSAPGEWCFVDCSPESPKGRTSLCYDRAGWESRKEARPTGNAIDMAAAMGVELLTEEMYRELQEFGEFDLKSSSWVGTPADLRRRGGALFGDRRYGRVFIYHNGAQSYYSGRGFRALLTL